MPQQTAYSFKFVSSGRVDLFSIKSCHQHDVIKSDRIINKKEIHYTYYPSPFEQEQSMCPLMINAYETNKGRHSFGMIDFNRPTYKAIARVECNGLTQNMIGIALCQSGVGLYQRITFDHSSDYSTNCSSQITRKGNSYHIKLSKGLCIYTFKTNGQLFRLTTFGFGKILTY